MLCCDRRLTAHAYIYPCTIKTGRKCTGGCKLHDNHGETFTRYGISPCVDGRCGAGPDYSRSLNPLRDITLGNWTAADLAAPEVAGAANPYYVASITDGLAESILSHAASPGTVAHMEDLLAVGPPAVTEEQLGDLRDRGWYVPGAPPALLRPCRVSCSCRCPAWCAIPPRVATSTLMQSPPGAAQQWPTEVQGHGALRGRARKTGTQFGYSASGGSVVRLECCTHPGCSSSLRTLHPPPCTAADDASRRMCRHTVL